MIQEKTWQDFRKTGLVLIINQLLHVFGWAIVFDVENDVITRVYPARVKFRGFAGDLVEKSYRDVSQYLKDNIEELNEEAKL